jgi:hypothetical protein
MVETAAIWDLGKEFEGDEAFLGEQGGEADKDELAAIVEAVDSDAEGPIGQRRVDLVIGLIDLPSRLNQRRIVSAAAAMTAARATEAISANAASIHGAAHLIY